jgi:geranylgeranyl pyrophosphate synthase
MVLKMDIIMLTKEDTELDIKNFLKKHAPTIDEKMQDFIPRKASKEWIENALGETVFELDLNAYTEGCNKPIWDLLDRGGKRFRPILTCIVSEAVGGTWENGLKLAPIVELIHNGTLMADDVEDDSQARRGEPCTHHKFGVDTAVNTGTIMYFWPMAKIFENEFDLDESTRLKIYDLYLKEMIRVSSGQVWDIAWHHGGHEPNENQYLNMCLSKTGVLTKFACQLGAIMGRASEDQYEALGEFGQIVGVGFQIQDDILELTEDTFKEGKGSIGGDIHEGKRTLIVIRTLEVAESNDKKRLIEILDSHTEKESEIKEALDIINKYDGIDYSRKKAEKMVLDAWDKLDKVIDESNAKIILKKFAEYLVDRKI